MVEAGDDPNQWDFCPFINSHPPDPPCHPTIPSILNLCPGSALTRPVCGTLVSPIVRAPCHLVDSDPPHCFHETGPGCDLNVSAPPACDDSCIRFYGSAVAVAADEGGGARRLLVAADYLPVMRRQLEAKLMEIGVVAQRATEQIEAQLAQIEVAEQALRDRAQDD